MSAYVQRVCIALLALYGTQAHSFENLDFEQAMPVTTGDPGVICCLQPTASILPSWEAISFDGFLPVDPPLETIFYNSSHIGGAPAIFNIIDGSVAFLGGNGLYLSEALSGEFSLQIDGRSIGGELSQVGLVPDDARSIRFLGDLRNVFELPELGPVERPISEIELFLGDTKLQIVELEQFANHKAYGANIPAGLAGTQAQLRFTVPPVVESLALTLDDIRFSPIPVPEPASNVILALACSLAAARRKPIRPALHF